ncbi:MAG: FAD-dependent oxidoreductase [Proteobacteria bacterium]|nr:FAD-dependent oxidoreductase [Pseudomonadota bacterium]
MSTTALPERARIVIIGGGVIGCSIAYHLAKNGCPDVVLLERRQLTCGTTWHAAGLLTTLRDSESQTWLARYSQQLYAALEEETGQATGIIECGSIQLATSAAKAEEMRRGCTMARMFGIENHEVTAGQIKEMWPLLDVGDVVAGFHFPRDGRVNPTDVTQALAKGARMRGARIFEHIEVTGIVIENGAATGVETESGTIRADVVVNCAGMWAREVGRMAGVDVPLQAAEHYYLVSETIAGVHRDLPIIRDPANCAYLREEGGGKVMLGFFEPDGKPWALDGIPQGFEFGEIQPDWERMEPHIHKAMARLPALYDSGIKLFFCGPESFTPDHNYLMGEAPDIKNFFVAAGFNSLGILSGGGVGYVMARWILEGQPPMDIWDVNLRRMQRFQNNGAYLRDRTGESLGIAYQMHWPHRQWETARGARRSPFHDRLAAAGAVFGQSAGWERPYWFARAGQAPRYEYDFNRQNWFDNNAEEHRAVRERVGVFDQTSFSKLLVQGRDASAALNRIASANMDVPPRRVVYTPFLNAQGGIEADVTVTRLASDEYLVVTPAFTHTHVLARLRDKLPRDAHCVVTDVTSAYAVLNLQGPQAPALLAHLSGSDCSDAAFAYGHARELELGYQRALALRVSYSGEAGYELYVPTDMAIGVFDQLVETGTAFGLAHCGYHTLASLRIEKGFREWAHDIGPMDNPLDAGLAFACAWDKPGGFIGREALLALREQGPLKRRMVQLLLDDPEPVLQHDEPVFRNGQQVGRTTSAAYGHSLGACVAMAYVEHETGVDDDFIAGGRFEVEQAGRRCGAKASLKALYDPKGLRMRGA